MRSMVLSGFVFLTSMLMANVGQAMDIQAGKQYVELSSPVPVEQAGKIEVIEFFWYGCPHCYSFEPVINPWVAKLPSDVNFIRIPAFFGGLWDAHGQMFLTLQSMGVESKVHQAIFKAIQEDKRPLAKPEDMAIFLASQGVDQQAFLDTYNSFAVQGAVANAKQFASEYKVMGVPTMIVNGKYRTDVGMAGGQEAILQVVDALIAKERKAQ